MRHVSCVPGSRAGLWIVESQIATPGLYCVIIALARNLNYQYYLTISIFMNNNNNTFLSPDHKMMKKISGPAREA